MKEKGILGNWLEKKFVAWQNEIGRRTTVKEFAEYLGVNSDYLNQLLNGNRKKCSMQVAQQIAQALGDYEIMDILGYRRPEASDILAPLPASFRDPFLAALKEARSELVSKGILYDSPDAEEIIKKAFARHGVKIDVERR
jgi:transcriptional regulator with XRE-family HTH domain